MTTEDAGTSELDQHFQNWLNEPWPKGATDDRRKLWLAFKAGADWALQEIRKNAGLPDPQTALKETP